MVSARQVGRFRARPMAISAAFGYACDDDSPRPRPLRPPPRPAWARPSGSFRDISEAEALFFAGAALSALDSVAKSEPPWAGAWRARLALKSAAAVAQNLLNRREDEAALRDAVAWRNPARISGPREESTPPSGRSAVPATRSARSGSPRSPPTCMAPLDPEQGRGPRRRPEGRRRARPARAGRCGRGRRGGDQDPRRRRAARPVLRRRRAGQSARLASSRAAPRRRALLAPVVGRRAAAAAGRARLGQARRAQLCPRRARRPRPRPRPFAPRRPARRGRAKAARQRQEGALAALLADDAVSAAAPIPGLSDRARRRLFERLVALGAARELTGRTTFRLYGL